MYIDLIPGTSIRSVPTLKGEGINTHTRQHMLKHLLKFVHICWHLLPFITTRCYKLRIVKILHFLTIVNI